MSDGKGKGCIVVVGATMVILFTGGAMTSLVAMTQTSGLSQWGHAFFVVVSLACLSAMITALSHGSDTAESGERK